MGRKFTSLALAGAVGVGGLTAGAVLGPAVASAATGSTSATTALDHRISEIEAALAGLVKNGTLTQTQADKVATTLDQKLPHGRQGRHGLGRPNLQVAASALGMTKAQLAEQLRAGKSLADVAKAKGVSTDTLVAKLVTAAQKEIAAAVKAGRLTQAQADSREVNLKAHVTQLVNRPGLGREHHRRDGQAPAGSPSTTPTSQPST